jgi:hypothetical protein
MRDIVDGLIAWRARDEPLALATVVKTWVAEPRRRRRCPSPPRSSPQHGALPAPRCASAKEQYTDDQYGPTANRSRAIPRRLDAPPDHR